MGRRYAVFPQMDEGTVVSWWVRELAKNDELKADEILIDDRDAAWRVAWALSAYEHAIKNRPHVESEIGPVERGEPVTLECGEEGGPTSAPLLFV